MKKIYAYAAIAAMTASMALASCASAAEGEKENATNNPAKDAVEYAAAMKAVDAAQTEDEYQKAYANMESLGKEIRAKYEKDKDAQKKFEDALKAELEK